MMNAERKIGRPAIIKMEAGGGRCGSTRRKQIWVNKPEYAVADAGDALSGIGLMTTNVSVGCGTDTPFETSVHFGLTASGLRIILTGEACRESGSCRSGSSRMRRFLRMSSSAG